MANEFPRAARFDGVGVSLIRRMAAHRRDTTIDLGLGEPNIEPAEWMRELASKIARDSSWSYSANAGYPSVRAAVASYTGTVTDGVCVTAGSQEALYAAMQTYVSPGDEILVPDPGFLAYPTVVRLAGGTAVTYPLDAPDWTLDRDSLRARVTERTRGIILNAPSNPMGSTLSRSDLEFVGELAARHGLIVFSDEVYREIWYGAPPTAAREIIPDALVIGGLSKSHSMTGLRVGWIAGEPEHVAPVIIAHQYITTCASVVSQRIAEGVLAHSDNESWLESLRARMRERREAAIDAWRAAASTPVAPPAGAFYLFAPVPSCGTIRFCEQLIEQKDVLAIPGAAFGEGGEGWLRISCATDESLLREGISRIGEMLDEHGR